MNLIKRFTVYIKTLLLLTGFCVLMAGSGFAQTPSASFTSNVFAGCAPLSVSFTNLSSQATAYSWDFGNGNTSTLTNPTNVYLVSGYYTVTLVAINGFSGERDTLVATNYIHVIDDPVPDFTASPLAGCAGNNYIAFTNLSSNANSFIWDFGDGSFSTQSNPVHNYVNPGTYTVKLIARNGFGCTRIKTETAYITIYPNPPASFTVNQQSSCDANQAFNFTCTTPGAMGWLWNFGDGNTSALQNPTHIYGAQGSYTVSLIVYNANGCSDTLVSPGYINIGASLVPSFTVDDQSGCIPHAAQFTCTVPNATSWNWDFGDGNTSLLENPSHTYAASGSYAITLTVTTSSGCNGTVTLPAYISVESNPVPSFTVNSPNGCSPHTTTFTNTTSGAVSYYWNLGNGFTSTDPDPTGNYPDTGSYTVTLIATSGNGCTDSITMPAAVNVQTMSASFSGTPRAGCAPLPVNFTASATPAAVSWSWDFGDGNTGLGSPVSHTFSAIGNYTITLIATSAAGCTDTVVRTNYIRVFPDSTNYTVPDTMLVCLPPGAVSFTDPTTGSNSWLWDFGDGNTSTVKNPTHTYTNPGVYTVTLNTGMAGGCTQTINPYAYVNVVPFQTSPITSLITSPCAPFTVELNNLTAGVASYLWDFGDGTTSTLQNPVHVYAQPGTYTISLLLTAINGCQTSLTTTVTFGYQNAITVSDTLNCLGDTVSFGLNPASAFTSANWDFGDGSSSGLLQPTHVYTTTGAFNVSVTVTDTSGCVYTFTFPNAVNVSNPVPSFTINQPTSGCVPYTVQFTNTSTGASGYYWYFGDGTNSNQANPSHTYTTPGVYTVTMNAARKGCVRSLTITDYITVNEATAAFTFTPDSGCMPLTATFTDQSVNAISWLWDFGDGATSALQHPVHTYTVAPTGPVTLIIVDSNGCSDTASLPNVVGVIPDIQVSDTFACKSSLISFSTTLNAASYLWDFGDGTTSSLQNPSHVYLQTGTFTVALTCVMASGCTTSTVAPALVTIDAPVAGFMSPTLSVCAPSLVSFINQSQNSVAWSWDFGDGTSSSSENPSHIYNDPGTYTVSLIAYSDSGCADTLVLVDYITVPGTVTDFSCSALNICENTTVQFTDLSVNATSWVWNFGDGSTSSLQHPQHLYTAAGSYTVTLITSDSTGCSSFYSFPTPVTVNTAPVIQAAVTSPAGCTPHTVTFNATVTGALSYYWNFGNGDSALVEDTSYTYTTPGIFYPSFIATGTAGCTDTFSYTPGVVISGAPSPSFTSNLSSTCAPATVSFNNTSTGVINPVYSWNFGNGQTSGAVHPSATFVNPGTYQVTLVVANGGGCSDSVTTSITINSAPSAAAAASSISGCSPVTVNFTNTSSNATGYQWNFGDGGTSTAVTPSHTYPVAGTYVVTLIATSGIGCSDTVTLNAPIQVNQSPNADFSRTPVSGCEPLTVSFNSTSTQLNAPSYVWNFGNGQTGSANSGLITYTAAGVYNVSLIVTNAAGCADSVTKNVTVLAASVAQASADVISGCGPLTVNFTNNSLNASSYSWNFGDGGTSTQVSPTHTYTTAGTYQVTLIASGGNGCVDTLVLPAPIVVGMTPVADFTRSPAQGCTPLSVSFTSTSTQLDNPSYQWDFGNGQSGSLSSDNIMYSSPGTFPVTLVVTNSGGCSDTSGKSVTIGQTPQASAQASGFDGCAPYGVTFTNNSLNASYYLWNFGDGTTSTQASPVHTYAVAGDYQVTLIAGGTLGCADTFVFQAPIHVKAMPDAAFGPVTTTGCTPLGISFTNTSTGLVNPGYLWDFGNGTTSSLASPTITYTQAGTMQVSLVVTNDEGCSDTAFATVNVHQSPVAQASVIDTLGCSPHQVTFSSTSILADSIYWGFGDGTFSSAPVASHIYAAPGTYQPYLVATTLAGCSDTLYFPSPVQVHPNPVASFTVNQTSGCSGQLFQFTNQSTPSTGVTYQWNIAGTSHTGANPAVSITTPGFHHVSLIVTSPYGCADTLVQNNYIQVADTAPPPVSPILSVSVMSNTSVRIIWQNSSSLDLAAYVLYRYNPQTGVFDEIMRDNNPLNSQMNVTSFYMDTGLNTLNNVYTYKLSTVDACSNVLPLSSLTAHTTINVTATPVNNTIRVTWTRYLGCGVSTYEIDRTDLASGVTTMIASVPSNIQSYTDQGFYCPDLYSYRIRATSLCGTNYMSLSDTSVAAPVNLLANQRVEVVRSTVINDADVLTEWLPPVLAPSRVVQYNVMRSTDNVNFTEIAQLPSSTLSYIDYDTDVHHQEYYYRIDVVNDCMITGVLSNNGASILLKADWIDEQTKLWWTPYTDWDTGVDYYIIEKETSPGIWQPLKTVGGNVLNTILDE